MNFSQVLRTGRLVLTPVAWADLPDIAALKADPQVFAVMLGGVRALQRSQEELADDISFWARHGIGMWSLREGGVFVGLAGIMERPDGRGLALRYALYPAVRGRGLAREAAAAVLRFAHAAGHDRIVAVTREDNFASRMVLGGIGMREVDSFTRDGRVMLIYESRARG